MEMNKPDPEKNPCYYCTPEQGRNPHCHGTCERFAHAHELNEADKKAKHDFDFQHQPFLTEALKDRIIKNQTKYNSHGLRRK